MVVKILTGHNLVCLSLNGGCRDSSESTHVKMPHCWKSHAIYYIMHSVAFHLILNYLSKYRFMS